MEENGRVGKSMKSHGSLVNLELAHKVDRALLDGTLAFHVLDSKGSKPP
jgi:hypothetical protein